METLSFYDVAAGSAATSVDLGSVNRDTSDDTVLRIFNNSTGYQAENVTVSIDGDDAGQLFLSMDGQVFTAEIEIGDIPPQSYSAPITLRRVSDHTVAEQACSAALNALPVGWVSPVDTTASGITPLDTSDS